MWRSCGRQKSRWHGGRGHKEYRRNPPSELWRESGDWVEGKRKLGSRTRGMPKQRRRETTNADSMKNTQWKGEYKEHLSRAKTGCAYAKECGWREGITASKLRYVIDILIWTQWYPGHHGCVPFENSWAVICLASVIPQLVERDAQELCDPFFAKRIEPRELWIFKSLLATWEVNKILSNPRHKTSFNLYIYIYISVKFFHDERKGFSDNTIVSSMANIMLV